MNLYEILVPTVNHNNKPYRTRFHRVWDNKIRSIAKGLTILQPVKGQWISENDDLVKERMIPVRIACTPEQINLIADITANYYQQKAIMFYQISNNVTIKCYPTKTVSKPPKIAQEPPGN